MRHRLLYLLLIPAVILPGCHRPGQVTQIESVSIPLDYSTSDTAVSRIIAPYKKEHDAQMMEVLGQTDVAMVKEKDQPEHLLGNFVADVVYNASVKAGIKTDLCLLNNGGLRTSLPKGDITRGKIFELMPFDNELVVVEITGDKMRDLLSYIVASGGLPVAGLKMGIKGQVPVNVLINGQPFDKTKNYFVATSDYLSGGGDKMSFFASPVSIKTTGIRIRDALIDHCRNENAKGKKITAALDGRIYYETK